jgi:hypothetical protein
VLKTVEPGRFKIIMVETEAIVSSLDCRQAVHRRDCRKVVLQVSDEGTIARVQQAILNANFSLATDLSSINSATYNKNKVFRRADVSRATPPRERPPDLTEKLQVERLDRQS